MRFANFVKKILRITDVRFRKGLTKIILIGRHLPLSSYRQFSLKSYGVVSVNLQVVTVGFV